MKGLYLMELDENAPIDGPLVEVSNSDDDLEISLHALTELKMGETMHQATTVQGASVRAPVDLGPTHLFIVTDTSRYIVL
jgi:hypothetical protein